MSSQKNRETGTTKAGGNVKPQTPPEDLQSQQVVAQGQIIQELYTRIGQLDHERNILSRTVGQMRVALEKLSKEIESLKKENEQLKMKDK